MNASDGTNSNGNNRSLFRPNDQRKWKGRQKLKMEKIENEKSLQVTFCKRRAGLFKKASELNTLCGAESAIVVFSSADKVHSYGHPSVETIANRFLNTNIGPIPPTNQLLVAHHEASSHQLNQELIHKEQLLVRERQRGKELNYMFEQHINELNYEQLNQLQESVLRLKSVFESRHKDTTSWGSSTSVHGPNPEQSGPSVGFTILGEFKMTGCPNAGDPTHRPGGSTSSYSTHFDPNMEYMIQYPCGARGSGGPSDFNVFVPYNYTNSSGAALFKDTMTTTSDTKAGDGTQDDVSNKFRVGDEDTTMVVEDFSRFF